MAVKFKSFVGQTIALFSEKTEKEWNT